MTRVEQNENAESDLQFRIDCTKYDTSTHTFFRHSQNKMVDTKRSVTFNREKRVARWRLDEDSSFWLFDDYSVTAQRLNEFNAADWLNFSGGTPSDAIPVFNL